MNHFLAKHILVEYHGVEHEPLNNKTFLEREIIDAVIQSGATLVHHFFHEFTPHGITGVVLIAESHVSIHTWPERGCALVDILTCSGFVNLEVITERLEKILKAKSKTIKTLNRGDLFLETSL